MSRPKTDEELLAECDVDTFRAGGPGGQHVNTTDSAVRLSHRPSGIVIVAREERSQYRNKRIALGRLRAKLRDRNRRPRPRIPTRKTRGAKERILSEKKRRGEKKRLRSRPRFDD